MKLIIGGACQGKKDYVSHKYKITDQQISDGQTLNINEITKFICINNFHLLVKRLLENNEDPTEFTERILTQNPEIIIIMDEIGNGIIPLEKSERVWREETGRIGCFLAKQAEEVERIVCGLAVQIK